MNGCRDWWPADCEALLREGQGIDGVLQDWAGNQVWAVARRLAVAVAPDVVELAGGLIAFCFLGWMVFGNPGRWLRYAGAIFAVALLWVVVLG